MWIVSACLAGLACRHDGAAKANEQIVKLVHEGRGLPVCPEQLGGLPTPRPPAERSGTRVVTREGRDVTCEFERGAAQVLLLAEMVGADLAILKARSPSCGVGHVCDGTFSGTVVAGDGVCAALLKRKGIRVITEEEL